MNYSVLFPYIEPYVPGCSRPMITQFINRIVRTVCAQTRCWKYDCESILLGNGIHTYELMLPERTQVVRIESASFDGRQLESGAYDQLVRKPDWDTETASQPCMCVLNPDDTLRVWPTPAELQEDRQELQITLSVKPSFSATGVDNEWLLDREAELISNGVLSLLYAVPGREWTDTQAAQQKAESFNQSILVAKTRYRDNQAPTRRIVAYGGI